MSIRESVRNSVLQKLDFGAKVVSIEPLCINGTYVDHLLDLGAPVPPLLHLLATLELKGPELTDKLFWNLTAEFADPRSVDFSFWNAQLSHRMFILAAEGVKLPHPRLAFRQAWFRVSRALNSRRSEFLQVATSERCLQKHWTPERKLELSLEASTIPEVGFLQ